MKILRGSILALLSLLFVQQAHAQNPYSRSFPIKIRNINVGEIVISFDDVIEVGDFDVILSTSANPPNGTILPPGFLPLRLPLLNSALYATIETTTSFRGAARVTVRVLRMDYDPRIPFRLFCADGSPGSVFRDITAAAGKGSMYTSGYRSSFSVFLVGLDLRDLAKVIHIKFDELTQALDGSAYSIERNRYKELQSYLWLARTSWTRGDAAAAIEFLDRFVDSVKEGAARGQIPNSHNDLTNPAGNVAGDLFARTQTLLFSLRLAK